jgi:hypothetical protein
MLCLCPTQTTICGFAPVTGNRGLRDPAKHGIMEIRGSRGRRLVARRPPDDPTLSHHKLPGQDMPQITRQHDLTTPGQSNETASQPRKKARQPLRRSGRFCRAPQRVGFSDARCGSDRAGSTFRLRHRGLSAGVEIYRPTVAAPTRDRNPRSRLGTACKY